MSESNAKPASKRSSRQSEEALQRARNEADIAFIQSLAEVLREHDLAEIEVSREIGDHELEVRLSRAAAPAVAAYQPHHPAPAAAQVSAAPLGLPLAAPAVADQSGGPDDPNDAENAVTAPMVGTVYLAADPESQPYVGVGDRVEEGQTLLIIEAMKTMNHIPAPRGGVVREVLVSNGQPVEYGAPLMILR